MAGSGMAGTGMAGSGMTGSGMGGPTNWGSGFVVGNGGMGSVGIGGGVNFPGSAGGVGYPQPPTSAGELPVLPPLSVPMDLRDLANSLLTDESSFDVFLVGADGTLVGANSLILSKISATFRKLIEEARRKAAFAAAGGGGGVGAIPGENENNSTATAAPPPPVGGVGSPLEENAFEQTSEIERPISANQVVDDDNNQSGVAPGNGQDAGVGGGGGGGGGAPSDAPGAPVEPPKYVVLQMPFSVSTDSLNRFVRFLYTFEIEVVDAKMRQVSACV